MRAVTGMLALLALGAGCGNNIDDCRNTRTCPLPPDAGAGDAGASCEGVCVPALVDAAGWSPQPFMLWRGATLHLQDAQCPGNAPNPSQVWYSSPDETPLACPTCSCAPSTGTCTLPSTVTVGASPVCPGDAGDAGAPFDPPAGWDGGCTTNEAVANVDCDGGPCLVTVGPLTPLESGCAPTQAVVSQLVTWDKAAFGCAGGTDRGTCKDPSDVCVPAPPPPPSGFSICVSRQGDDPLVQCPLGYPVRSVFYLGGDDTRGCAPCDCGPPEGSSCSSLVSVYSDSACSAPVGSVMATSSGSACVSVPAASSLGSERASAPTYTPGACQPSGGESTGSVQPVDPFTFCCQQ